MARLVSLGIIAALIVCLGITFIQVITPFLAPLFLAAVTAVLAQPVLKYFLRRCRDRRSLAALLTTGTILGSVMIPLLVGTLIGVLQIFTLVVTSQPGRTVQQVAARGSAVIENAGGMPSILQDLSKRADHLLGPQVTQFDRHALNLTDERAEELEGDRSELASARSTWITEQAVLARGQALGVLQTLALKTLGAVGSTLGSALGQTVDHTMGLLATCVAALVALFVFTLALYYFLAEGPELLKGAQALIPVEPQHQRELLAKFESSVRAVVLATFLAALCQGLATAIAVRLTGIDHFLLLLIGSTLAALIPMGGTALIWAPCAGWLMFTGHWGWAVFLIVFGIGVVGTMDNVIRTMVLQSDTALHPLLAFISVIGALQLMGLWGLFLGPIVACCLHSLVEIFNQELKQVSVDGVLSQRALAAAFSTPQDVATVVTDESVTASIRNNTSDSDAGPATAGDAAQALTGTAPAITDDESSPTAKAGSASQCGNATTDCGDENVTRK